MAAMQVRQILDQIRHDHRQLAAYYESLEDAADDENIKCLLEYMGRHESSIDRAVDDYERSSVKGTLDTWVAFVPDFSLDEVLAEGAVHLELTADEVIYRALTVDHALIEYYQSLAQMTSPAHVRELFENLVEDECAKDHEYARSILGFEGK